MDILIESKNLYRFPSLLAGVTFSRYPANKETANNKGVLYRHFSVIFYDNLVLNPQIIKGKAADSKFLGIKRYPRIIKTADSKPAAACTQCRSEAGAEGSVAPSLKFNTNILMHFY